MSEEKNRYQEQIERFYKKTLPKFMQIKVGNTPNYLLRFGAQELPVKVNQSVLGKCIRIPGNNSRSAHGVSRSLIESIPDILEKPALLVRGNDPDRIALLSEKMDQDGEPMLLALKLNENDCHNVTSFYGKEECRAYLERQTDVTVIDIERAKQLSRVLGFQLPMALKVFDSDKNIPDVNSGVKPQNVKSDTKIRSSPEIVKDIRQSGFQATKSLIRNIKQLDRVNGKENALREICSMHKEGCKGKTPEEKELVEKIAAECKQQELSRTQFPAR